MDDHINGQHEMTTWYKCGRCNFSTVLCSKMKRHVNYVHNIQINEEELRMLIVKDFKEIDRLKKLRILEEKIKIKEEMLKKKIIKEKMINER